MMNSYILIRMTCFKGLAHQSYLGECHSLQFLKDRPAERDRSGGAISTDYQTSFPSHICQMKKLSPETTKF